MTPPIGLLEEAKYFAKRPSLSICQNSLSDASLSEKICNVIWRMLKKSLLETLETAKCHHHRQDQSSIPTNLTKNGITLP
jgi:hypothetical protein